MFSTANYVDAAPHKKAHDEFVAKVGGLKTPVGKDTIDFAKQWFVLFWKLYIRWITFIHFYQLLLIVIYLYKDFHIYICMFVLFENWINYDKLKKYYTTITI